MGINVFHVVREFAPYLSVIDGGTASSIFESRPDPQNVWQAGRVLEKSLGFECLRLLLFSHLFYESWLILTKYLAFWVCSLLC